MTLSILSLQLATLGWGMLCGAMVYEHAAAIPQWARSPPESLTMWSGEYRLRAERFWICIHPVLVTLLVTALVTGWSHVERRESLYWVLGGYLLVLGTTAAWYVPELMRLTSPDSKIERDQWRVRSRRWELLSLVRGVLLVGLAWPMLQAVSRI